MPQADRSTGAAILAAVPPSDIARSEAFYDTLTGRPVDEWPMPVLVQWRWGGGVLHVVEDSQRAGGGLVTMVVASMSEATTGLRHRGSVVDHSEGTVVAQVATLTDPDVNEVTLVEAR